VSPNLYTFFVTFPRRVGAAAMPVITTPEGEWIGDTSAIIDNLERRHPDFSVVPDTPILRFAAYLFEIWGDEFWLPVAMNTRWRHPENFPLFQHDAGTQALPGFPRFLQNLMGTRLANKMRAHLPRLGIAPETDALIGQWTRSHLDALERHFSTLPFLLGTRPSLADYGMIAPLYAHLARDPWSFKNLIEPRRHLHAWIKRMNRPLENLGSYNAEDRLPETLDLAVSSMFGEMLPYLEGILMELRQATPKVRKGQPFPRFLGDVTYPCGVKTHHRIAMPYTLWMAQRALDVLAAMPPHESDRVREWLKTHGGEGFLTLNIPRLRRAGLSVAMEN